MPFSPPGAKLQPPSPAKQQLPSPRNRLVPPPSVSVERKPTLPTLPPGLQELDSVKSTLVPPGPPTSSTQIPALPPEPGLLGLDRLRSTDRIQTTFKQLSQAAVDLNAASDELSKPIYVWETALKKLNLGVPAWVDLSSGEDRAGNWWDRGVGYTKLKDLWAIALRTREGHHASDGSPSQELWPFNEAPRWMRIEAVAKLPELLEALLKQAEDTTQQIRKKIAQASELAEAIGKVADDSKVAERR